MKKIILTIAIFLLSSQLKSASQKEVEDIKIFRELILTQNFLTKTTEDNPNNLLHELAKTPCVISFIKIEESFKSLNLTINKFFYYYGVILKSTPKESEINCLITEFLKACRAKNEEGQTPAERAKAIGYEQTSKRMELAEKIINELYIKRSQQRSVQNQARQMLPPPVPKRKRKRKRKKNTTTKKKILNTKDKKAIQDLMNLKKLGL